MEKARAVYRRLKQDTEDLGNVGTFRVKERAVYRRLKQDTDGLGECQYVPCKREPRLIGD